MINWLRRFGFRFVFAYSVLYILPFPVDLDPLPNRLPGAEAARRAYNRTWMHGVDWIGQHLLGLGRVSGATEYFLNGDSTFGYLRVAIILVLAALIAAGWSLAGRGKGGDARVASCLRLALRYYLAGMMMNYGLAKFGHRQFPGLHALPEYLTERYGDSSPMRLLWAFMAYSPGYQAFTGVIETLSGTLLLFSRMTLLGSLLGLAAVANVAAIDSSYDVGLKLFTIHLLAFMAVLAWPDRRRLADFFLHGRPTVPPPPAPAAFPRLRTAGLVLKAVLIAGFAYLAVGWDRPIVSGFKAAPPAAETRLEGAFDVEAFVRDGTPVPAWNSPQRWQVVTFTPFFGTIGIHLADGERVFYGGEIDHPSGTLLLTRMGPTFKGADQPMAEPIEFHYTRPSPDELILEGVVNRARLTVRLRRSDFLLLNRGFHWRDDEGPYNR